MAGLRLDDRVLSPVVSGPDVWMSEETTSALTLPGAPKPIRYSELVTLHALRADLEAPGARRVPCQTAFTSVVSWRPWLKMGDRPGHLIGDGVGRYGAAMTSCPPPGHGPWRATAPRCSRTPARPWRPCSRAEAREGPEA